MTDSPYEAFIKKLNEFGRGQSGIRNPFVIVAVDPALEHRTAARLSDWAAGADGEPSIDEDVTVQPIWLDELLPRTTVYNLLVDLGGVTSLERIESTMKDRLTEELIDVMIEDEIEKPNTQSHVVLLLNLGSLYPFTRASELFDELDRRNVRSTIGIPFPGDVVGEKLSFYGTDSRHYYPAHQIDTKIREVHLQR